MSRPVTDARPAVMADDIRQMIASGRLEPGTVLSVSGAAFWWRASRQAAHGAFRELASSGLIARCQACRRYYVAPSPGR
jgi:DNA-binding GntR family transcriptional regulator